MRSVLVEKNLMEGILLFLSNVDCDKFKGILIEEPYNSLDELVKIQNKHLTNFKKLKYSIVIKDYHDPRYGKCTRFNIRHQRIRRL